MFKTLERWIQNTQTLTNTRIVRTNTKQAVEGDRFLSILLQIQPISGRSWNTPNLPSMTTRRIRWQPCVRVEGHWIRIPSLPEMMLPNENYHLYFEGDERMNEEQKKAGRSGEQVQGHEDKEEVI